MEGKLIFLPVVADDLAAAIAYYEPISPRLAARFRQAVNQRFDDILNRPKTFPMDVGDVRFARTLRFPYLVFFQIRDNLIFIIAVLHGASNPAEWRKRAITG